MAIYFSSDQNSGHAAARSLYRRSFGSVAEMDHALIERWNSAIEPDDDVWHLDDFAARQSAMRVAYLLKALNGHKHIVGGNNGDAAVRNCDGRPSVGLQCWIDGESMGTQFPCPVLQRVSLASA